MRSLCSWEGRAQENKGGDVGTTMYGGVAPQGTVRKATQCPAQAVSHLSPLLWKNELTFHWPPMEMGLGLLLRNSARK